MKIEAHYEIKVRIITYYSSDEIRFEVFNKEFFNSILIQAREEAFLYYQDRIDDMLEAKGLKYIDDRQARKDLHSYFDPSNNNLFQCANTQFIYDDDHNTSIGVYFCPEIISDESEYPKTINLLEGLSNKLNHEDYELFNDTITYEDEINLSKILIHGIGNVDPEHLISSLEREYEYYQKNNLDLKNYHTTINFYYYRELEVYEILKSPFDWDDFGKPWVDGDNIYKPVSSDSDKILTAIIENGEGNVVEFKPSLVYNFSTRQGGIGIKYIIAKTIASFLNSNGGFLFIGVNDQKKIVGLENDFSLAPKGKDPKDFFLLEFDDMIKQMFATFGIKDYIDGTYVLINNKEIFRVIVTKSKRPIFIFNQGKKEFFIRGMASSRKLEDPEEIATYCQDHWSI